MKQQVIDMSLNGSGVRDMARVLGISPTTVIHELKKKGLRSPPSTSPS
jgi:transposase-like protein